MGKQLLRPRRHSYILRCWQERASEGDQVLAWRFSIREVTEKPEEHACSSPGELLDLLLTKLKGGTGMAE